MVIDKELVDMYGRYFFGERKTFPNESPSFRPHHNFAEQWLENLARLFLASPKDYLSQHRKLVVDLAEKIREKRNYYFFLDALESVEKRFNLPFPLYLYELKEERPTISSFLMTEILLVWSLMEKEGRLLVCIRNGFQRKYFPLPEDPFLRRKAIVSIGHNVLAFLPFMEPKHLDLIPDKFGPLEGTDSPIEMPIFDQTAKEVLEDAKARQRYALDPAGALVRWTKGCYDLEETFIKAINGALIGRAQTPRGGLMGYINLETGLSLDFIKHNGTVQNPLALALISAYHKLVTAKELRPGKEARLGMLPNMSGPDLTPDAPTVVYVPRTTVIEESRIKRTQTSLPRYPVFRESPRDHARRLKKGEMSADQRKRVEEYERRTGKNVLSWLGPNRTYVLPHEERTKRDIIYVASKFAPSLG
ncbi:MAG: hypothetical protein Q7S70_02350 [bacterium]|nr:hypothetical protein [bacterium]